MTPEAMTALAALIGAIAAVGSTIAAIIAAIKSSGARDAAEETRSLVQQVIAVQQTNTQQQQFHFHGPTTVGSVSTPAPADLVFPSGAVPANAPALPAAQAE